MNSKNLNYRSSEVNLYPAIRKTNSGDFYGYINEDGKFVIPPKFEIAYDFNQWQVAIVVENGLSGVINIKGEYIVKPIYKTIQPFKEGIAIFIINEGMGAMDQYGRVVTKKIYSYISNYSETLAVVEVEDNTGNYIYGYINKEGKEVIEPKYLSASVFKEGVAVVKVGIEKYYLINKMGEILKEYRYDYVGDYNNKIMVFIDPMEESYGYIDVDGEVLIKPRFASASEFKDGVAIVSEKSEVYVEGVAQINTPEDYNGDYGLINLKGNYIYKPIYSDIINLGQGRVAIGRLLSKINLNSPNVYAIGDIKGNILTEFKFLSVERYYDKVISVNDKYSTYFLNLNGQIDKSLPIIKGQGLMELKNDIIFANIDYIPLYISKYGKIVYEPNDIIYLNSKYLVKQMKYKPNVNYIVYYPKIVENKNKKVQLIINNKLIELSKLRNVKEDVVLTYTYFGEFSIKYYSKDLLVLDITGYYYSIGGAHGLTSKKTPNIDLKTGMFYELSDLFIKDIKWQEEINKIIKNEINMNPQYANVYKNDFSGIKFDTKSQQDFYVDNQNLYIYFQQYEIAPYSEGIVTFRIPFYKIDDIIDKNSLFYKSFNNN